MEQKNILTTLRAAFPEAILDASPAPADPAIVLRPGDLAEVMAFLQAEPQGYTMLLDLTCVDWPERPDRFEMVYHVFSPVSYQRLRVKAALPADEPAVASLTFLWKNADWLEREVFDMFGVRFEGHPYLRRILTYERFEGHPLRKTYPWRLAQPRIPLKDGE